MDILSIENLKIETIIGVLDWERQIKQIIYFDLQWSIDAGKVAKTDSIESATDYDAISKAFSSFVESHHFFLIETLAQKSAEFLLNTFKLSWLKLKVSKPGAIRHAQNVAVIIERRVDDFNGRSSYGNDN